jgi:hypothetical protein
MGAIVPVIVQNLPGLIDLLKQWHAQANPGAPPLTDEQVHAGLLMAVSATVAKDDAYLAAQTPAPPAP